jgi:protein CpxP
MTKNKFLIVVSLLVSNFLLIGFLVFRKPPHPPMEGPKRFIIESLHFDKQQIDQFSKLILVHKENTIRVNSNIDQAKGELYKTLSYQEKNMAHRDSLLATIVKVEAELELLNYNHFLDIKKLCKTNQLTDYKKLTHEMARFFSGKPKMKR